MAGGDTNPENAISRPAVSTVRRCLRDEPQLWLQHDLRNRWFCPHCGEVINSIVLPPGTALGMLPELPGQLLEHLQVCSAVLAGIPAQKRLRTHAAASGMHQALHDASLRQRHTMKPPPKLEGYEIGSLFHPMEAVGGDFYEFIPLAFGRLGIGIGDASGHGVEACMLAAVTKKLLQIFGRAGHSPKNTLSIINRELFGDVMQGAFITTEYTILDSAARTLTYARAGHTPPIVYNPQRTPQVMQLTSHGLPLGIGHEARFDGVIEEKTITLQKGDLLVLYTDGLIELNKTGNVDTDLESFINLLKKYYEKRSVDDLCGQIWYNAEKCFRNSSQPDDIAMVAIKVTA
jgi:serine phosphatase RsbU (regulator of sigma subunit)